MNKFLFEQSSSVRNHPLIASAHAAGENRNVFETFIAAFIHDLKPEGPLEVTLAARAATLAWRLNRAQRLEAQVLSKQSSMGTSMLESGMRDNYGRQTIEMIARWESGLERSFHKTLDQLVRLKRQRKTGKRGEALETLAECRTVKRTNLRLDHAESGTATSLDFGK